MPTLITHALVPLAAGKTLTAEKMPSRFWVLAVICSMLPDGDCVAFSLGIPYGAFLGHRGFSHSVFFAMLLSSVVCVLAFRKEGVFSRRWWKIWAFFFLVSASHGILDAFTNGGLGIALLSPFDATRYFSPWRPIDVSPIGVRSFFTSWGFESLLSEVVWIWLPLAAALVIAKKRRQRKTVAETPGTNE